MIGLRGFLIVAVLLISFDSFSQSHLRRFKTDTVYSLAVTFTGTTLEPIIIDLDNQCETEALIDIDIWTLNVPDKFSVSTMDTVFLINTPLFGRDCAFYPPDSCYHGYIEISEGDFTQSFWAPVDHIFNDGDYTTQPSLGRIKIITAEKNLLFWIYPNQSYPTVFRFYLHPSIYTYAPKPVEVFIGEYACDSVNLWEIRTPNNVIPCDSIFVDGVRFTNKIIGENFDSIFVPLDTWIQYSFEGENIEEFIESDTVFYHRGFSEHGCEYRQTLYVYTFDTKAVYIPNAISPNNDGKNDRFEPYFKQQPDKIRIQVFNRWGGKVFDSFTWSWSPTNNNPAVFVYLVTAFYGQNEFYYKGSVTVLK